MSIDANILLQLQNNEPSLCKLDLSKNDLDGSDILSLANALTNNTTLTELDIKFNYIGANATRTLLEPLKTNKTLKKLNLRGSDLDVDGLEHIAKFLTTNQTLEFLDISHNRIANAGAIAIAEALKVNKTLIRLDLSDSGIGNMGVEAIAEALKENATLYELGLLNNELDANGAIALFKALKENCALGILLLDNNDLSAEAEALGDVIADLKSNKTFTHLFLSNTKIGPIVVQAIAKSLKVNQTLSYLNLGDNQVGDTGAQALAESLVVNRTLKELILFKCVIGNIGAQALASSLSNNEALSILNLALNNIRDDGAQALASYLEKSNSLNVLSLYNNNIGILGAQALAIALKSNNSIIRFNIDNRKLDNQEDKDLSEYYNIAESNNIGANAITAICLFVERNKRQTAKWINKLYNPELLTLKDMREIYYRESAIQASLKEKAYYMEDDIDQETEVKKLFAKINERFKKSFFQMVEDESIKLTAAESKANWLPPLLILAKDIELIIAGYLLPSDFLTGISADEADLAQILEDRQIIEQYIGTPKVNADHPYLEDKGEIFNPLKTKEDQVAISYQDPTPGHIGDSGQTHTDLDLYTTVTGSYKCNFLKDDNDELETKAKQSAATASVLGLREPSDVLGDEPLPKRSKLLSQNATPDHMEIDGNSLKNTEIDEQESAQSWANIVSLQPRSPKQSKIP